MDATAVFAKAVEAPQHPKGAEKPMAAPLRETAIGAGKKRVGPGRNCRRSGQAGVSEQGDAAEGRELLLPGMNGQRQ